MVCSERVSTVVNTRGYKYFSNTVIVVVTCSVGRITGRLPKELADEVVQSLLEFFRYII